MAMDVYGTITSKLKFLYKKQATQQTFLVFQDVFAIRLPKMSSRRLARRLQDVFARRIAIMSSRRLGRQKNVTLKTS